MRKTAQPPPMAKATLPTTGNRTGSWRAERPVFVRRLAPCSGACPAGEDVPRIELAAGRGEWELARRLLAEENPFPGVCGRLCPHPCEEVCNRGSLDGAVSVRAVERRCADETASSPFGPAPLKTGRRVAVVGAGPAGLTAAYFLSARGHEVELYDAADRPGGMPAHAVPSYRLPAEVLAREVEAVLRGVSAFHPGRRLGEDLSWEELASFEAVFVAAGAWSPAPLEASGAELLESGFDLLRAARAGEARSLPGRAVVIGGGNTALDVARVLRRRGAEVSLCYRRRREDMPASAEEVEEALEEGVELSQLLDLHSVERAPGGGLRLLLRPMVPAGEEPGRARVEPSGEPLVELEVARAFSAVGFLASEGTPSAALADERSEPLTPRLRRILPLGRWAARPPTLVGGDAVSRVRTVATAIGAGKEAAIAIDVLLRYGDPREALAGARETPEGPVSANRWLGGERERTEGPQLAYEDLNPAYFGNEPRGTSRTSPAGRRVRTFVEVRLGLARGAARREALRCFHCGLCDGCDNCFDFCPEASVGLHEDGSREILYDYCKGCGICAEECPRAAIDRRPE